MTDYAAAAVQPIVQGLITVSALGGVLSFAGRGASLVPSATGVGRDGVNAQGVIVLTLDKGLPGNAGAVEPVPAPVTTPPLVAPFAPLPRTLISARSPEPRRCSSRSRPPTATSPSRHPPTAASRKSRSSSRSAAAASPTRSRRTPQASR